MTMSPYQSEQQPEELQRKYELPEEDLKGGAMMRFSIVMLFSGLFVLLKDALFNWNGSARGETVAAPPDSPAKSAAAATSAAQVVSAVGGNNEPAGQDDEHGGPEYSAVGKGKGSGLPDDGHTVSVQLAAVTPVALRSGGSIPSVPGNDNRPVGQPAGEGAAALAGPVGGTSGTGGGNGNSAALLQSDDGGQDDPRETANRAPVAAGPARLNGLLVNQSTIIAANDLLQNVSDADGDELSVQNLQVSSGQLIDRGNGTWSFTPDADDVSEVIFTYDVSDGTSGMAQVALLDLLPVNGETFIGTAGDDEIVGTPSGDIVDGGDGSDKIVAHGESDVVDGGEGSDQILAGEGNDILFGGAGDDDLFGGAGGDVIFGGEGNDTIFGGDGNDVLSGEGGNDRIIAGAGNDVAEGGSGDDHFFATIEDGDDTYLGGDGVDTYDLSATTAGVLVDLKLGIAEGSEIGRDQLSGIERVVGGAGDDVFLANAAANQFAGGAGNNRFDFSGIVAANSGSAVRDQISDFHVGDKIDLSGIDASGSLAGNQDFELVTHRLDLPEAGKVDVRIENFNDEERTVVRGKINDEGGFEFEIELEGRHELTKDDFIGVS